MLVIEAGWSTLRRSARCWINEVGWSTGWDLIAHLVGAVFGPSAPMRLGSLAVEGFVGLPCPSKFWEFQAWLVVAMWVSLLLSACGVTSLFASSYVGAPLVYLCIPLLWSPSPLFWLRPCGEIVFSFSIQKDSLSFLGECCFGATLRYPRTSGHLPYGLAHWNGLQWAHPCFFLCSKCGLRTFHIALYLSLQLYVYIQKITMCAIYIERERISVTQIRTHDLLIRYLII